MIEKTIQVWIDEEPVDPKPGDAWLIEHMYRSGPVYEVRRFLGYRGDQWVNERGGMSKKDVLEIYGVDIPALDRAHLIGG